MVQVLERVLVLNAGSSSLKWSLLDAAAESVLASADIPYASAHGGNRGVLVRQAIKEAGPVSAVGFRVVHGGMLFRQSVRVDSAMITSLATLNELAPLHNPVVVECMREALDALPHAFHVAAFDTAFHKTIPREAATYAIPREWTERWGIRRFGFHGLSVAYAAQQSAALLPEAPHRHVVCHLGAGCSVTAVRDGLSVDTSMGFTPLDGVMMATRSGAIDPGMLLFLMRHGIDVDLFYDTLEHHSGLLGVSGISSDVRQVIEHMHDGDLLAKLAYEMFVYSIARAVGSMVAVLGGVDVITFTGGVGEHQPPLRRQVLDKVLFTGVEVDDHANEAVDGDGDIATRDSRIRVLVIKSREDLSILREVQAVVAAA